MRRGAAALLQNELMSLTTGTRLGRYEIRAKIGEGGMGQVYLAEDVKLGRKVALKILPPGLAFNQDRMLRFVQEAKAASSLNHPNIITIHEIDQTDSGYLIATEFIEGETLRQRMTNSAVTWDLAIDIAAQVATALAAAHAAGIIHRDIKPENIMLRHDDIVKVLDFGLAKLAQPLPTSIDTEAATRALPHTTPGMVMGTVAYMSPEQARALPVDARTDIWSLGVVLYEMVTRHVPFEAATGTDTLVAILEKDPPALTYFCKDTPETLEWILTKALRKDKDERYQTAKELLSDLNALKHQIEFQEELERSVSADRKSAEVDQQNSGAPLFLSFSRLLRSDHKLWWLAAAVIMVGVVIGTFLLHRKENQSAELTTLPKLSQLTFAEGIEQYPSWSADGKQVAYSAEVGAIRKIFIKRLDSGAETQLTSGANDDIQPAWSPDNQTILFVRSTQANEKLEPGDVFGAFEHGDVWRVNIQSGKEERIIDNAFNPVFSPDGKIIAFDASWVGPHRIWIADSQGHNAQQISSDTSEEVNHVRPHWSPDASRIVFQNIERTKFNIRVIDVAQRKIVWVTNDLFNNLNPVWSRSTKFIYFSSDRGGGYNAWRMPVSPEGVAVGLPQQLTTGAGQDVELAIAPDGKRLALSILKQNADIWKLPVSPETGKPTGTPQEVIATTREDSRGAWSLDGSRIAFNSDRGGEMNLWLYSLNAGSAQQLTTGLGGDFQANWSPDGKRIAFFSSRSGNADIWTVEVETGQLTQLTRDSSIDINPFFSPEGKYIAYQSDRTGRLELWVMNADGSEQRQLTRIGIRGHFQRWNKAGDAIVFRSSYGDKPGIFQAPLDGSEPQRLADVNGGSHLSFCPDYKLLMDVVGHKALWISPLVSDQPQKVFEFVDKDIRIDYPVWSPDGKWILFDRFRPQGGDIWIMDNFE